MEVTIKSPNGMVVRSFYKKDNDIVSSIIISLQDRKVYLGSTQSGSGILEFHFYNDDIPGECDTVLLTADNPDEMDVLGRYRFDMVDKDEMWFVLISKEVFSPKKDG